MAIWSTGTVKSTLDTSSKINSTIGSRTDTRSGSSSGVTSSEFDVVGINTADIPAMKDAIMSYVKRINNCLAKVDIAKNTNAFRSEEVDKSLNKYITSEKKYCTDLVSQLLAFSDKLSDISEAWEKHSQRTSEEIKAGAASLGAIAGSTYKSSGGTGTGSSGATPEYTLKGAVGVGAGAGVLFSTIATPLEAATTTAVNMAAANSVPDPITVQTISNDAVPTENIGAGSTNQNFVNYLTDNGFSQDHINEATTNTDILYDYLTTQEGMSPKAASAVIGNVYQESKFSTSSDSGTYYGLMQWGNDRRTGLNNYAASTGTTPDDINAQLGYMHQELQDPYYARVIPKMEAASSVKEASHIWQSIYEGAAGQETQLRVDAAQAFYDGLATAKVAE